VISNRTHCFDFSFSRLASTVFAVCTAFFTRYTGAVEAGYSRRTAIISILSFRSTNGLYNEISQTIMILRRGALEFIEAEEAFSKALLTILQITEYTVSFYSKVSTPAAYITDLHGQSQPSGALPVGVVPYIVWCMQCVGTGLSLGSGFLMCACAAWRPLGIYESDFPMCRSVR
jgi:hypothetical protein